MHDFNVLLYQCYSMRKLMSQPMITFTESAVVVVRVSQLVRLHGWVLRLPASLSSAPQVSRF